MKKLLWLFSFILIVININAQNVGIGTASPSEKLDINGNLNIAGALKANGTAGQPGQVLTTNNNGNIEWGNNEGACPYKNFVSFKAGSGTWTIPATGVTSILVEAWGGGGGASQYAGGGGGGYVKAQFDIQPGAAVSFTVGMGGSGSGNSGTAGLPTTVAVPAFDNTTYTCYATGGSGASISVGPVYQPGLGGFYQVDNMYNHHTGINGQSGYPAVFTKSQTSSGVFSQIVQGGNGGDSGNTIQTGGKGATRGWNADFAVVINPSEAGMGGGGGSGLPGGNGIPNSVNGGNGGPGKIIIWYK